MREKPDFAAIGEALNIRQDLGRPGLVDPVEVDTRLLAELSKGHEGDTDTLAQIGDE